MKITVSPTLIACASVLAAATHGSLLSGLLGNIHLQLSVCPELSIGTGGKGNGADGKPVTQSSNPACSNYVPPEQQQKQQQPPPPPLAVVVAESSYAESSASIAAASTSSNFEAAATTSSALAMSAKEIGTVIEIPRPPAPEVPSSSARSVAYNAVAPDIQLPHPTQETLREVLAQEMTRETMQKQPPALPALPTPTQEAVKCVWVTRTIDLGKQPAQAPAPTVPPAVAKADHAPVTSWLFPAPANLVDSATTRTVLLPDGQQQVIVESRNAGFFEYAF